MTVRPPPRTLSATETLTVRLPADELFGLTYSPAQQSPGLGGTATGSASAQGNGSARAAAEVELGGTASGLFQVGHSFRNDTARQIELAVRLEFEFEYEASATPPSGRSEGTVSLSIYARTGQNRIVREIQIARHSTGSGAVTEQARRELRFELPCGPGEVLTIYAAGSAEVEVKEGRTARTRLALQGLKLEVTSRPAPALSAAHESR